MNKESYLKELWNRIDSGLMNLGLHPSSCFILTIMGVKRSSSLKFNFKAERRKLISICFLQVTRADDDDKYNTNPTKFT